MSDDDNAVKEVLDAPTESAPVEDDVMQGFDEEDAPSESVEESEVDDTPAEEPEETPEERQEPKDEDPSAEWEKLNGKSQDRFRQMANSNRELQRQLQEVQARQAQFATEQQLLDQVNPETGDYYTPEEVARIGAFQRLQAQQDQLKQEEYETQVRMSQNQLLEDGERALREFPQFDANSKDFDPELSKLVEPVLQANAITDPNTGEVVGMRVSPYQLLKTYHDALSRNSQKEQTIGRAEAQRATEKMLANVDHAGSAPVTKTEEKDPILDGFDNPY